MATGARCWPDGSVDTLLIVGVECGYARRDDHLGRMVWQLRGEIEDVAIAAENLAPPGSPDAPHEPLPEAPEPPI
jgi:hypothetical protein